MGEAGWKNYTINGPIMRVFWKIATAAPLAMLLLASAHAAVPQVAVFDFELVDTSLEGATYGPRADQQARLAQITGRLRDQLAKSGRVTVVDITPVAAQARAANLRNCGGCEAQFANQVGADLAVTGWVQKVSNLILNMNVMVTDAKTGHVTLKSVDMRGNCNTDESWSRASDWLIGNDLLAPPGKGVFL
jgi:hypothetical protein